MSIETWKKEFYPKTAQECVDTEDLSGLLTHSLNKWIGLRPRNLKKHGLKSGKFDIFETTGAAEYLSIDSSSCSLCVKFLHGENSCNNCPLYKARDQLSCDNDDYNNGETEASPYREWQLTGDAEPMIALIKKAKKDTINVKPSSFVRLTRVYKTWCNISVCPNCGLKAKYEDFHIADPCPNCGSKLTERIGRWKPTIESYVFGLFKREIGGKWEILPEKTDK